MWNTYFITQMIGNKGAPMCVWYGLAATNWLLTATIRNVGVIAMVPVDSAGSCSSPTACSPLVADFSSATVKHVDEDKDEELGDN